MYWTILVTLKTFLTYESSIQHVNKGICTEWSIRLLQNLLNSTNIHTHHNNYKHMHVSIVSKIAINMLLTRWHSLNWLHPYLPIVHRMYGEKYFQWKSSHPPALSFFYPSCHQKRRRSLKEGHFIQLSLSSYWRRQGGRKETEWEGGGSSMCVAHLCKIGGETE